MPDEVLIQDDQLGTEGLPGQDGPADGGQPDTETGPDSEKETAPEGETEATTVTISKEELEELRTYKDRYGNLRTYAKDVATKANKLEGAYEAVLKMKQPEATQEDGDDIEPDPLATRINSLEVDLKNAALLSASEAFRVKHPEFDEADEAAIGRALNEKFGWNYRLKSLSPSQISVQFPALLEDAAKLAVGDKKNSAAKKAEEARKAEDKRRHAGGSGAGGSAPIRKPEAAVKPEDVQGLSHARKALEALLNG